VTVLSPSEGLRLGPIQFPAFGMGLYGMVYGVILGAVLHLLIQVPGLLRYQFRWTPVIGLRNPGVQRVLVLLGPRVITMACIQAYYLSRDNLASHFGEAGVGALNLGWTIQQVPETMIGTAIAIALLPSLAEHIQRGERDAFRQTVNRALRAMLALGLPAAALLALGVRPLAGGFFGLEPARLDLLTACTIAFLIGLVGDTWLEVAVRSFYANQDTRTPLAASALQAAAFFGLAALLSSTTIGLVGIPLAAAITFTIQALGLLYLLNRRFPGLLQVRSTLIRAALAALAAGLVAFGALRLLPFSDMLAAALALPLGALAALPFIWPEVKLLARL
jgi:putative peptidoglycan lipid II flippase